MPHFCGSRTLVNGLKDVLGSKIQGLICPIDNLIGHKQVYKQWTDNISQRVQQYSFLSAEFRQLLDRHRISKTFHMALEQNQNHFLDAIRLFIELDIRASALDGTKGNTEQRLFTHMLKKAQENALFRFPATPSCEVLKNVLIALAQKEVEDCKYPGKEKKRCEEAVGTTRAWSFDSIVVHGIHQFTPTQLRLLLSMEKMGITIIFLFNYQRKYSKIYASWMDIYSCFEAPVHHDTAVGEYAPPTMQNPSNALACALGELCEDRDAVGGSMMKKWHQLYKSIPFIEFANITEYAHFVSNHFDVAIRKYSESRSVMERGNGVWNKAAVLRLMDEQIYTADRDVHTLLKIYYPEYAKDRHFLSYPIGQFFAAIYKLWDYEKGQILFDVSAIKECLSSNILRAAPGEVLLRTFYNVDILFENIATYDDFQREIAGRYVENYKVLSETPGTDALSELKNLSVYNKYKVPKKDVLALIKSIEEINQIAASLFALDHSRKDFINFGKHFAQLECFLKKREPSLANEGERKLITALQLRLESIQPEKSDFSGTFRDLKQGLYYYLKQKNDDEQNADWIVKNYEQIDGDILLSKGQFDRERPKVYHFACVSDRDMNKTVNDQLPWPLTDEFIRTAYAPIDLQFQVYYTALGERSHFLRYAFFYGLYYNRCGVRLSYVRQYGEETTEPFALLSILGMESKAEVLEQENQTVPCTVSIDKTETKKIKYDQFQMMDMFLCPYRFFLDYVMENGPVVQGDFLYQKYFENLLIEAVWRRIGKQKSSDAAKFLTAVLDQEVAKLKPFFGFWKDTEIHDLKLRAKNYLVHEVIGDGREVTVKPFAPEHMQMRKLFGAAKFIVDVSEVERKNPYPEFEQLASRSGWKKEYSLHKLPLPHVQAKAEVLCSAVRAYVNQSAEKDKAAIVSDWCTYCVHKGNCMESYLRGEGAASSSREDAKAWHPIWVDKPVEVKPAAVVMSDVQTQPVEFVEAQQQFVLAEAAKPDVVPPAVQTAPETPMQAAPVVNDTPSEPIVRARELVNFEQLLRAVQEMVEGNKQEIQGLKQELTSSRSRRKDTTRIEARLAETESRSQELQDKLTATEDRLAATEAKNRALSHTVKAQDALLEKQKALGFTEEELADLHRYSAVIIFDTCSIMNYPYLLDGVNEGELVVVPKDVNNELEHHKTRYGIDDRRDKAQRAIASIFNYKRRFPLVYADGLLELVPEVYRAREDEKEQNDNKILAVAIRYKKYGDIPVIFITDDKSLANKASGEGLEVWTARDFLTPPATSFEESVPAAEPREAMTAEAAVEAAAAQEAAARSAQAREELLAQKISTKILRLEPNQIALLQNNGVKTIAHFVAETEKGFARMKAKKGLNYTAIFLVEQQRIKQKLDNL